MINLFETQVGFTAPITHGPTTGTVSVSLRLPLPANAVGRVSLYWPGMAQPKVVTAKVTPGVGYTTVAFEAVLVDGCAVAVIQQQ